MTYLTFIFLCGFIEGLHCTISQSQRPRLSRACPTRIRRALVSGNPFLEYVLLFLIPVVLLYLKLRFVHLLSSHVLDHSIPGFLTFVRFHFQNFELFQTTYDYGWTHRIVVGELPRVETKQIFQRLGFFIGFPEIQGNNCPIRWPLAPHSSYWSRNSSSRNQSRLKMRPHFEQMRLSSHRTFPTLLFEIYSGQKYNFYGYR